MTYDDRIAPHIPPSVAHADTVLRTTPILQLCEEHPDIVALSNETGSSLLDLLWNRLYHDEIHRRTAAAGIRWIGCCRDDHPNRRRINML